MKTTEATTDATTNETAGVTIDAVFSATPAPTAIYRQSVKKTMLWLATVVGSAIIGLAIKSAWDAPRPHLELSTVQLQPSGTPDAPVNVPAELRAAIADHAYVPDLPVDATAKNIRDAMDVARRSDDRVIRLTKRADELLELLRTRPATLDINERRREFVSAFFAGDEGDMFAQLVKVEAERVEQQLPAHYRTRRTSDAQLNVNLPTSVIVLSELDEEETARRRSTASDSVNTYERVLREAHNTNLLRRALTFMDPPILMSLISATKTEMALHVSGSKKLVERLDALVTNAQPDRMAATVIVTNRGGRPIAIRNIGVLSLTIPSDQEKKETITVDLGAPEGDKSVTVVQPGGVEVINLVSLKTAVDVVSEHEKILGSSQPGTFSASRLKLLFDGEGLSASVALARAGASGTDSSLGVTASRQVGAKGDSIVLDSLRRDLQ